MTKILNMTYLPNYIQPLFRPPSEWKSLILQVTNGCSWNKCTFCDMYTEPQKKFKPKNIEQIEDEVKKVAQSGQHVGRIFLADGDAMTLSVRRLTAILDVINKYLPDVTRVSAYCLPRNVNNKSVDDLILLESKGLKLVYVGCESGDDQVLQAIKKGEDFESSLNALQKIKQAGIKSSVMILCGMGGKALSAQHAINSAKLMNAVQPEFLSTLVVSSPLGQQRVVEGFKYIGLEYQLPEVPGLLQEMHTLISHLDLEKTVFRSDHSSNYLSLKGTLGKDKAKLLNLLETAINHPNQVTLREEWQRGL